jgi:hypothetical protein
MMNGQDVLDKGADMLEPAVKALIEKHSKEVVDKLLDQVKVLIPGPYDDMAVEAAKPKLEQLAHDELMKLADKISPRV